MLTKEKLDQEWVDLISKAKQLGFSVDEVRYFLQQTSRPKKMVVKTRK